MPAQPTWLCTIPLVLTFPSCRAMPRARCSCICNLAKWPWPWRLCRGWDVAPHCMYCTVLQCTPRSHSLQGNASEAMQLYLQLSKLGPAAGTTSSAALSCTSRSHVSSCHIFYHSLPARQCLSGVAVVLVAECRPTHTLFPFDHCILWHCMAIFQRRCSCTFSAAS